MNLVTIIFLIYSVLVALFVMMIKRKHYLCIKQCETEKSKMYSLIKLYDLWMAVNNKSEEKIYDFFISKNIKRIAIYGMGVLGIRLYQELKDSGITVVYSIDKNETVWRNEVPVYSPEEELNNGIDAIIVTSVSAYEDVEKLLTDKGFSQIYGIDEILYESLKRSK